MNQAKVMRIKGSIGTGGGIVEWESPDASNLTEDIIVVGGNYLLLCNIALTIANLDSDLFFAEWSNTALKPHRYEYHTRQHTHAHNAVGAIAAGDLDAGPRLIYQTPLQWWAGGDLDAGTLQLELSHAADVVLIAVRVASLDDPSGLGVDLA